MMPQGDWFILMGVGGFFLILGIFLRLWGRYEEKRLIDALAQKPDLREFSSDRIESPQPGALKFGGWIAVTMGGLMLIIGIIFWLLSSPQA